MIRQTTTYIQRHALGEDYTPDNSRYHLHEESGPLEAIPTFAELRETIGGRCEGKVYRDRTSGEPIHCGYVFARRERIHDNSIGWDDSRQFRTEEVWVTFDNVVVSAVDLAAPTEGT